MLRLTSSGCVATSKPPTVARPEVGGSSPHKMRMVVDLPAPLGPRNPKISPRFTSSETRSTAVKSPKRFTRFSIRTAGPEASGGTRRLLLAHQRDEHVFERRLDLVTFERRRRSELFRRGCSRFDKQVHIGAHRLHRQHARLALENLSRFPVIRGSDAVAARGQSLFERGGSVQTDEASMMHEPNAIGALGFVKIRRGDENSEPLFY